MLGICGYYYFITPEKKVIDTTLSQEVKFPEYHDRVWRFSRTQQNVVGFFFDAFTGDHLLRILEDDPTLREKLDGFVYFPDTVAVGACTALSTASIYGGAAYKPEVLNKTQPNRTIVEKYTDALSLYPNVFSEKRYDVVLAGMPIVDDLASNSLENKIKYLNSVLLFYGDVWGKDYIPHWMQWAYKHRFSLQNQDQQEYISQFSIFMALLRATPLTLRSRLYILSTSFDGMMNLLNPASTSAFLSNIAFMQFMEDFVTADDDASAFKMIYTSLSHTPWLLPSDDLLPVRDPYPETRGQSVLVNGLFPEHYYTERHMIHFLADFIEALKRLGVYDNTRIVIVSDHDGWDSWHLHQDKTPFIELSPTSNIGPNALLMFKDFNSHAPLKISDALMSIEDTPSLLMDGIAQADGIPTLDEIRKISDPQQEEIRVRTHCGLGIRVWGADAKKFNLDAGIFEIKGTMFKKENWRKLE